MVTLSIVLEFEIFGEELFTFGRYKTFKTIFTD